MCECSERRKCGFRSSVIASISNTAISLAWLQRPPVENGKVFAVGAYLSRFSFEDYRETFLGNVHSCLFDLLKSLRSKVQKGGEHEAQAAAELH